uniref:Tail tape measure protein n=1 Tax=Siphoviridae sp. ctHNH2 TaxID=2827273 RepID=A0A8S5RAJ8_9CAUD|nr:MAG TPA: tail tape measure protein [Siphoviridae sp. ctHNH2]
MAADIGPKIGIDGEKEFRDALKACQAQLKTLGSEMKAVTAEFQDNASSMEALSAKSSVLNKSIAANDEQMRVLTAQYDRQRSSLDDLAAELEAVKQEYGETSKEVGAAQNAYNRQYQALASTENAMNKTRASTANLKKQLSDLETGVDDVGSAMDEAGQKTLSLGDILKANLLSDAIMAGIKAVASGIKSLVSGAIEGYGESEQLVGGVETLFGTSAQKVQDYASSAYKTAGLSANAYMKTVTSFSASLLKSMGNDTEAASKKADQALTDMSDNANKMGSDMQSIQNAYQGFSKQNYTMLDNLKLGYGGTKEEMERLIADANALNAAQGNYTNYSIENYADIVDAIHTVQTEMGITGTTALEASTTIDGSIGAMEAAYANFVTGLGDKNADIGALTEQLIESAGTVAKNVLPVIENVVKNIAETVKKQGPEMITKFVAYATEKLPEVLKLGIQLIVSLVKGLAQNLPQLVQGTLTMVDTIVKAFVDSLPDIIEVGRDIVRGVWEGITALGSWLYDKVSGFFGGIVDSVKGMLGIHSPSRVFAGIGKNMALGLGEGFDKQMQGVSASIQSAIPTPTVDTVYNAAAGMVNGLAAANAGNGGSYTINLVLQNGAQIASWLLPDIRTASKNNPEVATA